jgi:hypothetical protein
MHSAPASVTGAYVQILTAADILAAAPLWWSSATWAAEPVRGAGAASARPPLQPGWIFTRPWPLARDTSGLCHAAERGWRERSPPSPRMPIRRDVCPPSPLRSPRPKARHRERWGTVGRHQPLAGCGSSRLAAGSVGAHTATLGDADVGAQAPAEKVGSSVATMATLDVRSRSLPSSPAGRILLNHAT